MSGDLFLEPFKDEEYSFAIQQLARYDQSIEKEFTVVNDRMTWMVVSESFIFTAFATAAAYHSQQGAIRPLLTLLIIAMPILGIAMAASVIPRSLPLILP